MTIENQSDGFFSLTGCTHDETLVAAQHLEPALNVCSVVAEVAGGLEAEIVDERTGPDFSD